MDTTAPSSFDEARSRAAGAWEHLVMAMYFFVDIPPSNPCVPVDLTLSDEEKAGASHLFFTNVHA